MPPPTDEHYYEPLRNLLNDVPSFPNHSANQNQYEPMDHLDFPMHNNELPPDLIDLVLGQQDQSTNSAFVQHNFQPEPQLVSPYGYPYKLVITTEPEKERRFRYRTEKNRGPLLGDGSTSGNKIYPSVELQLCAPCAPFINESIFVRCELYTHTSNENDPNPKLHVHEFEEEINVRAELGDNGYKAEFRNLIIFRSRKEEWKDILKKKKQKYIPPQQWFDELKDENIEKEISSMDPTRVKLCFEAYVKRAGDNTENILSKKTFSKIISTALPKIERMSLSRGSEDQSLWLIVDNVVPRSTTVRFFDDSDDSWCEDVSKGNLKIMHKHVLIFSIPRYGGVSRDETIEVNIKLIVGEGDEVSESTVEKFTYTSPRQFAVVPDYSPPICSSTIKELSHNVKDEEYVQAPNIAYEKVVNMWESKDPNRLQDIKAIFRAKGKKMGPLQAAALYGQYEYLKNLVDFIRQKLNMKWLINTEDDSRQAGLKFLLRKSVLAFFQTPLTIAIENGNKDCEILLRRAGARGAFEDHQKQKQGSPTLLTEKEEGAQDGIESGDEGEVEVQDSSTSSEEESDEDSEDCLTSSGESDVDVEDSCKLTMENSDVVQDECNSDKKGVVRKTCYYAEVVKDGEGSQIKEDQLELDDVKLADSLQNVKI
ncbi:Nuclear factor NF-kappa-B p100 subunit [Frankliniella fusca]|uniref:Nuclear factor NF-kappa-B p100 subunit n=1 Tax=Frankliniella fusca TaxID=407009 RepID=A0AAE1LJX7_9NEOP|nr:Nuclear factor NF-kappa-B p100 subunit [Frankliniella fusca]